MINDILFETEKPHEKRVVIEANELAVKINSLDSFCQRSNSVFMDLDCCESSLLRRQLESMIKYHSCLQRRIEIFKSKV